MAQDYEALLKQILEAAACYSNGTAAADAPVSGLEPIPVGIPTDTYICLRRIWTRYSVRDMR